jgi:hypothetical protein
MNRQQFLILLTLVIILGGGGLIIHQRGDRSWENAAATLGGPLLPNLPINDIAQITIHSGTGALHLARVDNLWRVRERGNYPANFSQISGWLIKLADLKIVQSDVVGPSQLGRFALLPPGPATNTATQVEFAAANGKSLASLLLGKPHLHQPTGAQPAGMGNEAWPDGRYVMVGGNNSTLDVITDPQDNVVPQPDQWLNKDFIDVQKPGSIAVQFPVATNSWSLIRASETNDWQLVGAGPKEKLDADKISGLTSPLSSATFADVLTPDARNAASRTDLTLLTVTTLEGFTYTARIGSKQADNYPVTFSITASFPATTGSMNADALARQKTLTDKLAREQQYQNWTYLLPAYTLDPILKLRSDLLLTDTNTSTPAPAAPSK